jgi:fermentation-respiration switch protein FrsA (DUF1100 family)
MPHADHPWQERLTPHPLSRQDEIIPHSHGEQLAARCGGPVRTLYIDGAGHNDLELYTPYVEGLTDFVLAVATGSI